MARLDLIKKILILSVLYFVLGKLAFAYSISYRTVTSAIFFPEGLALAFVLLFGPRVSPGVFIGQFALAATTSLSLPSVFIISLGNTLEVLIGYFILSRLGFSWKNFLLKDYLFLVLTIALVLQPFSAGVGCASMALFDQLDSDHISMAFSYWWIGNTMGQVLLTPLILILKGISDQNNFFRILKIAALSGVVCFLMLEFLSSQLQMHPLHVFSLALAVIITITIRYEFTGALLSGLIMVLLVQAMTVDGRGPFTMDNIQERLLYLNTFIVGIAFSSALVGVVLKELRLLNIRYGLILNSVGEGIYGVNTDGEITFINPEGERLLGYAKGELQGKHAHSLIHHRYPDGFPYPKEKCPIYKALVDGKIHHLDHEVFWKKDGTSFPVEYFSRPLTTEDQIAGAVVSFNDISERKRTERELENQRQNLEVLVREKATRHQDEKRISEIIRVISEMSDYEREFDAGVKVSLEVLGRQLGWGLGHAYIYDEKMDRLLSTNLWYLENPIIHEKFRMVTEKMDFEPGEDLPGKVYRDREMVWIEDVNQYPNFQRAGKKSGGVVTGMGFPVISRNKVVGVLEFFSRDREKYSSSLAETTKCIGALLARIYEREHTYQMKTRE